jgi:hypothetical protein
MKKKSIAGLSGQLSRTQMKGIVAGYGTGGCPYACTCSGGARALVDPSYDPANGKCTGPVCYCPDESSIGGANCPCL